MQRYELARFYYGINLVWEECTVPRGVLSIPIPFMKKDHGFLRYREVAPPEFFIPQLERLDKKITLIKNEMVKGDKYGLMLSYLQILEEIKYGVIITKSSEGKDRHD